MIKICNKCSWLTAQENVRAGERCWSCSKGVYVNSGMSKEDYDLHVVQIARNRIGKVLSRRVGI